MAEDLLEDILGYIFRGELEEHPDEIPVGLVLLLDECDLKRVEWLECTYFDLELVLEIVNCLLEDALMLFDDET